MTGRLAALVICVLAVTVGPAPSTAQTAPSPASGRLVAEPDIALPLQNFVPFGATAGGEVWGFGRTADDVPRIAAWRDQAWQLQPRGPAGGPSALDGFQPAGPATAPQHAGELSADGTGVLLGTVPGAGDARTEVALGRFGAADFSRLPPPGADVLPAGEQLYDGARIAVAAVDGAILLAPAGGDVEDAVIRTDGTTWTREPVQPPSGGFDGHFKILALAASSAADAWLLAEPSPGSGRAVALYRRVALPDPHWVEVDVGPQPLLQRSAPEQGIRAARAVAFPGDPLTVAAGHLWIDVHVTDSSGAQTDATLHLTASDGGAQPDRSWCDVVRPGGDPLCDAPLHADLESERGTRSIATSVAGERYGARVVAGAARPDGVTTGGGPLVLEGDRFAWGPGAGDDGTEATQSLALVNADDGWIGGRTGATHLTRAPAGSRLAPWAAPWIDDLVDVAAEPGKPTNQASSEALMVSRRLVVLHFSARDNGWQLEPIEYTNADGQLATINAIAWPRPDLAFAVGNEGAIYERRSPDDANRDHNPEVSPDAYWVRDPRKVDAELLDVTFDDTGRRGYAVGRAGTVLRYAEGGDWVRERLPRDVAAADVYAVAFAGRDALIATASGLLVNDGSGWRRDAQLGTERVGTVAGLPDGGATVDGRFVRERAGGPWRTVDAPPLEIAAVSAYRDEGGALRSIVSTTGQPVHGSGPPPAAAAEPAETGFVLREDAAGWHDEQHQAFRRSGIADLPLEADPVRAFALDEHGAGWAVGGTAGPPPFGLGSGDGGGGGGGDSGSGTGTTGTGTETVPAPDSAPPTDTEPAPRQPTPPPPRAPSAEVYRYRPAIAQPGTGTAPVPLPGGVVRFAIAGHAACLEHCANLAGQGIAPDVLLDGALALAGSLHAADNGPRALLYTGGRAAGGLDGADGERYRSMLANAGLPVFPALGRGDGRPAFTSAFAGFAAPLGDGPLPAGFSVAGLPPLPPAGGAARTFYAFDSTGSGGTVRIVIIDQAGGALRDADGRQEAWLRAVLEDARSRRIPAIVVGARPLSDALGPGTPSDAGRLAALLFDEGASAYISGAAEDDPHSQDFGGLIAAGRFPAGAGASDSIPVFTTSTLGHQPRPLRGRFGSEDTSGSPAAVQTPSLTLLEIDPGTRDPRTNRADVRARQIPLLRSLTILLDQRVYRHHLTFVNAIGREPDRGGYLIRSGQDAPIAARGDPLIIFPDSTCDSLFCNDGTNIEARFESSDPKIGYFVRPGADGQDVKIGADGLPVASDVSPQFCPLSNGTVTLTVSAGGLSSSQTVHVVDGPSAPASPPTRQRPGTRPAPASPCSLDSVSDLASPEPAPAPAAPPGPAQVTPAPGPGPGPVPAIKLPAKPAPAEHPPHPAPPAVAGNALAQPPADRSPVAPNPRPLSSGPPPNITGGGAPQPVSQSLPTAQPVASVTPVAQVAPERERQVAPESEQAAVRYVPGSGNALPPAGIIVLAIALAAGAGAGIMRSRAPAEAPRYDGRG